MRIVVTGARGLRRTIEWYQGSSPWITQMATER